MADELKLHPAVPILFVRDVAAAANFYGEQLGFKTEFLYGEPPFYGEIRRGGAVLHLRHVHEPNFAELAAREESLILATILVSDVKALHAEFAERGVEFAQPLTTQVWGGTDFQIADPDGNRISFVTYSAPNQ